MEPNPKYTLIREYQCIVIPDSERRFTLGYPSSAFFELFELGDGPSDISQRSLSLDPPSFVPVYTSTDSEFPSKGCNADRKDVDFEPWDFLRLRLLQREHNAIYHERCEHRKHSISQSLIFHDRESKLVREFQVESASSLFAPFSESVPRELENKKTMIEGTPFPEQEYLTVLQRQDFLHWLLLAPEDP